MLEELRQARRKTIGSKQTQKALEKGVVRVLYVATDAEERVTRPLVELAQSTGSQVIWVEGMKELGQACGIQVGAAAAAVVQGPE